MSATSMTRIVTGAVTGMAILLGAVASAAEIEEVVVTAQKREEVLSDIPLAVSALTSEQLDTRGYDSIEDFTGAVPGLSINNYVGQARVNIRGIGQTSFSPGAEGASAFHKNGVYLARPAEGSGAFLDVERLEVVRGPQGTLYGRNATGGSVNVITRRPTEEMEARAQLSYGNYDRIGSEAVLSGPLMDDRLLGRVAFRSEDRDGFSRNLFNGKHYDDASTRSVRATGIFNATDDLSIAVIGEYHTEDDHNYATHFLGPGNPAVPLVGVDAGGSTIPLDANGNAINPRHLNNDTIPSNDREVWGVTGEITWTINDALTAKSITAFRHTDYRVTADLDATEIPFPSNDPTTPGYIQSEDSEQISQELQLIGSGERLNWLMGLYYFSEDMDEGFFDIGLAPPPGFPLLAGGTADTEAFAIFGQATYDITDSLSLTAGGRWSREERSVDESWTTSGFLLGGFGPCLDLPGTQCINQDKEDWDAFTPKVVVDYDLSDDVMVYFSASRGFKSGGFSMGDLKPAYDPEYVWAFEAGLKLTGLDGRVSGALSAFHYDYTDLQVQKVINGFLETDNAASSNVDGVELEANVQATDAFLVTGAFTFLDATFDEYATDDPAFPELGVQDLAGNRLPFTSKYTLNLGASYTTPVAAYGDLVIYFEWNYRSRRYFTEFNLWNATQDAVSTFNATGRFNSADEKWFVELYGKNLSDETVISENYISSGSFGRPRNGQLEPPRQYGITVGYNFF